MNYLKLFLLLITMLSTQTALAVMLKDPGVAKDKSTVVTEFGKTGIVDGIDPNGLWIRINNKKYILNGTGSLKLEDLHTGLRVNFNIEKARNERNGRVTRMWLENHAE